MLTVQVPRGPDTKAARGRPGWRIRFVCLQHPAPLTARKPHQHRPRGRRKRAPVRARSRTRPQRRKQPHRRISRSHRGTPVRPIPGAALLERHSRSAHSAHANPSAARRRSHQACPGCPSSCASLLLPFDPPNLFGCTVAAPKTSSLILASAYRSARSARLAVWKGHHAVPVGLLRV